MRHELLVYETDDQVSGRMADLLAAGIAAGDTVVAVLRGEKLALLREALGDDSKHVSFVDRDGFYTRREAALASYDTTVRKVLQDGASAVRLIGELPACSSQREWDHWIGYEAILNRAFAHHPVWVTCAYDARDVPEAVIDAVRRTHPEEISNGGHQSLECADPAEVVRALTAAPEPLPTVEDLLIGDGPRSLRRQLWTALDAARVSDERAGNLMLAAGEVLANASSHGGGATAIRAGVVGDRFVCEIVDGGAGLDDPLAGYLPPQPSSDRGGGLWVARQLTERLELVPEPGGGLAVRLWV